MRPLPVVAAASLFCSTAALAEPVTEISGVCPSVTVGLTGASPRRTVALFAGSPLGTSTVLAGPCAGTVLDIGLAHLVLWRQTDASGNVAIAPTIPPSICGRSVQWVDHGTCEVSDERSLNSGCQSLLEGMVAWWPGNGDAVDIVGGHDGTLEGTVAYEPGVFDDAFGFDGVSAVVVPHDDDLDYDDGEPFTYAMWLRPTALLPLNHFLGKRDGCSSGASYDYQFLVQGDGVTTPWDVFAGSHLCTATATDGFFPAAWSHVIGSYDGASWSIYVNGVLKGSTACSDGTMPVLLGALRIGGSGDCGEDFGQGWIGRVDEVMLWNRTLDTEEVACASSARLKLDPNF